MHTDCKSVLCVFVAYCPETAFSPPTGSAALAADHFTFTVFQGGIDSERARRRHFCNSTAKTTRADLAHGMEGT